MTGGRLFLFTPPPRIEDLRVCRGLRRLLHPPPCPRRVFSSGEKERWTAAIERLDAAVGNLAGDALLAAAFVSYAGPFPAELRADLVATVWMKEVPARLRGVGGGGESVREGRQEVSGGGGCGLRTDLGIRYRLPKGEPNRCGWG